MDLRALVDLNCIATQVIRFHFLEKYTLHNTIKYLQLVSNLGIKSWNKKGDFCPILLQTKRIDDPKKAKFRYAEKFKTCTTFKSKSID